MGKIKRFLSLILATALLFGSVGTKVVTVLAQDAEAPTFEALAADDLLTDNDFDLGEVVADFGIEVEEIEDAELSANEENIVGFDWSGGGTDCNG